MAAGLYKAPTANFSSTSLNGAIDDSATTITLNSTTGLQSPGYVVIDRQDANGNNTSNSREEVSYTGIAGSDLTGCTRGADTSTARSHSDGALVEPVLTVGMWNDQRDSINAEHAVDGTHSIVANVTITDMMVTNSIGASGASVYGELTSLSGTQTLTSKTLTSPVLQGDIDGWTTSTDSWVYASASTFTVTGVDRTAQLAKGTKLKFTNSGTKYAVVVASTFSTNTTVTIAVNDDYVVADAAITAPQYSYQENPAGFPDWFDFTTTWDGFSADPAGTWSYKIAGKTCFMKYKDAAAGTSDAANFTFTTPVTITNKSFNVALCLAKDNGTNLAAPSQITHSSGTTMQVNKIASTANGWTTSGAKDIFIGVFGFEWN